MHMSTSCIKNSGLRFCTIPVSLNLLLKFLWVVAWTPNCLATRITGFPSWSIPNALNFTVISWQLRHGNFCKILQFLDVFWYFDTFLPPAEFWSFPFHENKAISSPCGYYAKFSNACQNFGWCLFTYVIINPSQISQFLLIVYLITT